MVQGFYIFLIYVCNRKVLSVIFKCCIRNEPVGNNDERNDVGLEMRENQPQQQNPDQVDTCELINYAT